MNKILNEKTGADTLAYYLNTLSIGRLKELGFYEFEADHAGVKVLMMLVPFEWYFLLPEKTPIQWLSGKVDTFKYGITDSDTRWGSLAFSIYINPKKLIL